MRKLITYLCLTAMALIIAIASTVQHFSDKDKKIETIPIVSSPVETGWRVVDDNALISRNILFRYYYSPTPSEGHGEIRLLCVIDNDKYKMAIMIKPDQPLGLDYSATVLIAIDDSYSSGAGFEGRVSVDDMIVTELDGAELSDLSAVLTDSESVVVSLLTIDKEFSFEVDVHGFDKDNSVLNCN